jgi:hypothetical protein
MTLPNSLIEQLREEAISQLRGIEAFESVWGKRSKFFRDKLPPAGHVTRQSILDLGEHLSEAFQLEGKQDRSQGSLSSGGSVWEALVVWYLNLCMTGTRAVCFRGGKLCPQPIKDALSILHESTVLRSEPDVIIVSSEQLQVHPRTAKKGLLAPAANLVAQNHFASLGVVNLQCKTNWNDNAQIPMLWNMLYNQARKGAVISNGFTIGKSGYSLMNLGHFGYAFVTVPTQTKGPAGYKPTALEVLRVKSMTAGNYWGHPSKQAVCSCISQLFGFFTRNKNIFPNVADIGKDAAAAMNNPDTPPYDIKALLFPQ